MKDKLTDNEKLFIAEYRNGSPRNATCTYQKVFSTPEKPLTKEVAKVNAHRLLIRPKVAEYIRGLDNKEFVKHRVTAARIIKGLAYGAFFDVGKLFDESGQYKPVVDMDKETRSVITGFRKGEPVIMDKVKCLELLGKYLKLFTDKHEVSGLDGTPLNPSEVKVQVRIVESDGKGGVRLSEYKPSGTREPVN
jgi:phage terminase small subunit